MCTWILSLCGFLGWGCHCVVLWHGVSAVNKDESQGAPQHSKPEHNMFPTRTLLCSPLVGVPPSPIARGKECVACDWRPESDRQVALTGIIKQFNCGSYGGWPIANAINCPPLKLRRGFTACKSSLPGMYAPTPAESTHSWLKVVPFAQRTDTVTNLVTGSVLKSVLIWGAG